MIQTSSGDRHTSSYYASQPWRKRARGSGGWARWVLWTPLVMGGIVAAAMAARRRRARDWLRRFFEEWDPSVAPPRRRVASAGRESAMKSVREAILGNTKRTIVAGFGAPKAAAREGTALGSASFWQTDVWYYPLDPRKRSIMAITFQDGVANEVEFIRPGMKVER